MSSIVKIPDHIAAIVPFSEEEVLVPMNWQDLDRTIGALQSISRRLKSSGDFPEEAWYNQHIANLQTAYAMVLRSAK